MDKQRVISFINAPYPNDYKNIYLHATSIKLYYTRLQYQLQYSLKFQRVNNCINSVLLFKINFNILVTLFDHAVVP